MPSQKKRVRIERGLYRVGDVFYACATPPGGRTAVWRSLGRVGIMEARRLRDRFSAETQLTQPVLVDSRSTLAEVAAEWIAEQGTRVEVGEMSPCTYEIYEVGLRLHVLPKLGKRQVRSITPDELVGWIRGMRAAGFAPHTVHNYWGALHLVLRHAVRRGVIGGNPADRLTSPSGRSRARACAGSSRARRSSGCWPRHLTATGCRSPARCSPACGSASCSGSPGLSRLHTPGPPRPHADGT